MIYGLLWVLVVKVIELKQPWLTLLCVSKLWMEESSSTVIIQYLDIGIFDKAYKNCIIEKEIVTNNNIETNYA